jgi:restriction system protein
MIYRLTVKAWIIRSGAMGERDEWALTNGLAGGGFDDFPDLTSVGSRAQLAKIGQELLVGEHPGHIGQAVGQMWALRSTIKHDDLIVLPLKTTKNIALGQCTGGYRYQADQPEDRRHSIAVAWKRTDVPRSAFKDDLLYTINGALTIFRATRNNAVARLTEVLNGGIDPGSGASASAKDGEATLLDPVSAITVEAVRDVVRTYLIENFAGHKLTRLVAEILQAEDFTCDVSPPGPDYGVDILAGCGPLGLDSPTLVVEVKSESTQVGVPVLNQLKGALSTHSADQALLVAWGGLTKQAEELRRTQRLSIQVWTSEDVLDRLFDVYERLSEEMRARIPLKRTWILAASETG